MLRYTLPPFWAFQEARKDLIAMAVVHFGPSRKQKKRPNHHDCPPFWIFQEAKKDLIIVTAVHFCLSRK